MTKYVPMRLILMFLTNQWTFLSRCAGARNMFNITAMLRRKDKKIIADATLQDLGDFLFKLK